jgi:hypothetical protein
MKLEILNSFTNSLARQALMQSVPLRYIIHDCSYFTHLKHVTMGIFYAVSLSY